MGKLAQKVKEFLGAKKDPTVKVGYTAQYAIYVHENLEANHPNGGQAKFLEQPARELKPVLKTIIQNSMKRGSTMEQGMLLAGLHLQGESQKLVPVDTGNLKASAFTVKGDQPIPPAPPKPIKQSGSSAGVAAASSSGFDWEQEKYHLREMRHEQAEREREQEQSEREYAARHGFDR